MRNPNGSSKMDSVHHGAGLGRGVLAVDDTRRFGASYRQLAAAELGKEAKYGPKYLVPVTLRGFAYDEFGRCGPHACQVVTLLANAGCRAGAGHFEDLSMELWASFGVALARATALRLASFAAINHDASAHAPQESRMLGAGQRHATGANFGFIRPGGAGPAPPLPRARPQAGPGPPRGGGCAPARRPARLPSSSPRPLCAWRDCCWFIPLYQRRQALPLP